MADRPDFYPEWATDPGAPSVRPTENHRINGFAVGEKPTAEEWNWQRQNLQGWIEYFDTNIALPVEEYTDTDNRLDYGPAPVEFEWFFWVDRDELGDYDIRAGLRNPQGFTGGNPGVLAGAWIEHTGTYIWKEKGAPDPRWTIGLNYTWHPEDANDPGYNAAIDVYVRLYP